MSLKEIDSKIYYYKCLITSLESKLERVEPLSAEFDGVMNALFDARNRLDDLAIQRMKANYELATSQIKERP